MWRFYLRLLRGFAVIGDLATAQIHADDMRHGGIAITPRIRVLIVLTGALRRLRTIYVKLDHRVELMRLFEHFKSIQSFFLLWHKGEVLII